MAMACAAAFAACGTVQSMRDRAGTYTVECSTTATYVLTLAIGRSDAIDEFCGKMESPIRRIPLPQGHSGGAVYSDDRGRLYLLTAWSEGEGGPEEGTFSIFDGQWHTIELPKGMFGDVSIDRVKGVAYLFHSVPNAQHAEILVIDAHGTILRSFNVEPELPYGRIVLDSKKHLVIVPDFTGDLFVYDPESGRLLHRASAFGCAVGSGRDGNFYGLSCLGELATYDTKSYKVIAHKKYGRGESFLGRETYKRPAIAVLKSGTVYLANQGTNSLSMYRSGKSTPFRGYAGLPITDLQVDSHGNVYALVTNQKGSLPQQINVYQSGSGVLLRTYKFAKSEYPSSMTLVPPTALSRRGTGTQKHV